MSSSTKDLSSNNIIINIPPEYLENGKTLLIEKYFELFVDGYHLSKPSHCILHNHQLCLIDTQQQDLRSINSNHQLQANIDEDQLVQLIIELPCESLNDGKNVTIEMIDSNGEQKPSGNFEDLYNQSNETKDIHIKIAKESIQKGKTILIQKENVLIINSDDYQKEQIHHLNNNQFSKRDHLQSKKMMEITIELPPEFFNEGQTITFEKEDPQTAQANFPYHRQSKPDLQITNKNN